MTSAKEICLALLLPVFLPAVSCRKEAPRIVNIVNFVREIEPRSTPGPGWKTVLDDSDMASTRPVILQKRQNKGIFVRI